METNERIGLFRQISSSCQIDIESDSLLKIRQNRAKPTKIKDASTTTAVSSFESSSHALRCQFFESFSLGVFLRKNLLHHFQLASLNSLILT